MGLIVQCLAIPLGASTAQSDGTLLCPLISCASPSLGQLLCAVYVGSLSLFCELTELLLSPLASCVQRSISSCALMPLDPYVKYLSNWSFVHCTTDLAGRPSYVVDQLLLL